MEEFRKIAQQMKSDWDRRVSSDAYFWMSDASDEKSLWLTGERDFKLLIGDVSNASEKVALEIGCGIGRLLRTAAGRFQKVIGIDVSDQAIDKARSNLKDLSNIELRATDGLDLSFIADSSIDVVYTFASLTSVPTDIIANYLREIHRVLKSDGRAFLQMYIGKELSVGSNDTLHIRCYERENFLRGVIASGLTHFEDHELQLPFQVSFMEAGFIATIITLGKSSQSPLSAKEISHLLLPGGEETQKDSGELESWISLSHAKDLADSGHHEQAREALEYTLGIAKSNHIDIRDTLHQIQVKLAASDQGSNLPGRSGVSEEKISQQNLAIIERRFPSLGSLVERSPNSLCSWEETPEGPSLFSDGHCLDHPGKPSSAGEAWVKRSLLDAKIQSAENIIVFGLGGGYHIEALLNQCDKPIFVVEPDADVFASWLQTRDVTSVLNRIAGLSIGPYSENSLPNQAEILVRPQTQALHGEQYTQLKASLYGKRGIRDLHPSIAVLGPLQGGTLPICGYTHRALVIQQQRARAIDMSGFAAPFHAVEDLSKDKLRVVSLRNKYLEYLSQVILNSSEERPFDILICMAQAPISFQALAELKKKGIITVLWFVEDYLRFTYWKDAARYFDFVFTIQKGKCIEEIRKAGAGEVHYLPTAADPGVHRPLILTDEERSRWGSPISFVGAGYHNRQQTFAGLANLPFKIWGTEWPNCRPFDSMLQEEGRRLTPEEYIKIFNATDVNLNLHSSTERDGVDPFGDFINPRTFELASAGAFQLVDERSLLSELFIPGEEIITFSNTKDLREKIDYYLRHPEERGRIVERARARVLREHTYAHRMEEMLSIIYQSRYEDLKNREDRKPWARLLKRSEAHEELHTRCETAYRRGEEPILDGLVADIVTGSGKLTETEQKLLFLFHVRKQVIMMRNEEAGG